MEVLGNLSKDLSEAFYARRAQNMTVLRRIWGDIQMIYRQKTATSSELQRWLACIAEFYQILFWNEAQLWMADMRNEHRT